MGVGGRNGCRGAPAADARPAGHGLDQQSWADRLRGLRGPGSLHPGGRQPYRQPLRAEPNSSASTDTRTDRGADSGAHADRHPSADTQADPHAHAQTHANAHTQTHSVTNATADVDPDADSLPDTDPHRRLDVNPGAWRDDPVNAWLDLAVGGCTDSHTRQPDRADGSRNTSAARCSRSHVRFRLR
jgi:hypothetical protein